MVDGCRSKLVNVVTGALLFLLYTSELFFLLENKLVGYADDPTLITVVPSTGVWVTKLNKSDKDDDSLQITLSASQVIPINNWPNCAKRPWWPSYIGIFELWHFIPRWLLRIFFARFPEQLLRGLGSWESPGENLIIYCSMRDDFGALSCPFGVPYISVVLGCRYTPTGLGRQSCKFKLFVC